MNLRVPQCEIRPAYWSIHTRDLPAGLSLGNGPGSTASTGLLSMRWPVRWRLAALCLSGSRSNRSFSLRSNRRRPRCLEQRVSSLFFVLFIVGFRDGQDSSSPGREDG